MSYPRHPLDRYAPPRQIAWWLAMLLDVAVWAAIGLVVVWIVR